MAKMIVTKGEMLMDLVDSLIEMDDDVVLDLVNSVFVDSPYTYSAVDGMFEREVDQIVKED